MPSLHPDINLPSFLDTAEVADPSRLLRERERWDGIDDAPPTARVVVLDHGGSRRPIIHRGSEHRRSRLVSYQTGCLQITEGNGLPFQCRRWEIDGMVSDWQAHRFLISIVVTGVRLDWYPDGVFVRFGGRPVLVEIKRTMADLADPAYAAKLGAMAEFARRIGWSMQILYDVDVFGADDIKAVRRRNVQSIYSRRFVHLSRAEVGAVADIVANSGALTWGRARDLVAPDDALQGDAVIECAIARGHLLFDVDRRRTDASTLLPNTRQPAAASFRV